MSSKRVGSGPLTCAAPLNHGSLYHIRNAVKYVTDCTFPEHEAIGFSL